MKILLVLVLMVTVSGLAPAQKSSPAIASTAQGAKSIGRWRVEFLLDAGQKHLILEVRAKGSGTFQLMDTGPNNDPDLVLKPAIWSELTNNRISFSGEVELPLGHCCREIGTLTFKGRFLSDNSISGKLVFITSVDDPENPFKLRSAIGTFTATRIPA